MTVISFRQTGDFSKTWRFLERCKESVNMGVLDRYGKAGVQALREATPKDTGLTSESWGYKITRGKDYISIEWTNTNVVNGVPIVMLLQYGHGTRGGTYVQGIDFINPAIKPIFDKLANELWREVKK